MKQRWYSWTPRRVLIGLSIALAVWAWVDVRARGRVDPNAIGLHKTDFTVYTEAGAAFFDGRDPYAVTNPRGWGYLYPPLFATLVSPLHALRPENQVLVWFAISVAAAWGCWAEARRIARAVGLDEPEHKVFGAVPSAIGLAAVAAVTLPTLNCLQRGQVGIVQMYLLLWGFRLLIKSQSWRTSLAAGGVFSLPIVLKVTPALTVGYVLVAQTAAALAARPARRTNQLAIAGAVAGGTLVGLVAGLMIVPSMLVGWQANLNHLNTWWATVAIQAEHSADDSVAGDSYSVKNQSLANAVRRLGNWAHHCFGGGPDEEGTQPDANGDRGLLMDHPAVSRTLLAVRVLEACLLLAAAVHVGRRQDRIGTAMIFGLACASTLVIAPIARGHYFVQLLPAVIFLAMWLAAAGWPRWGLAMAWTPAALVAAHYCLMDWTARVGLLGIGTAVWFTVAALAALMLECGDYRAAPGKARPRLRIDAREASSGSRAIATTHRSRTELSR